MRERSGDGLREGERCGNGERCVDEERSRRRWKRRVRNMEREVGGER